MFGRDGLTLVASNVQCQQSRALTQFARSYLEAELEAADFPQTLADLDVTIDDTSPPGSWQDVDGTQYSSIVLRTNVNDDTHVVGVAMLVGIDAAERAALVPLATALAKKLCESGDFRAAL